MSPLWLWYWRILLVLNVIATIVHAFAHSYYVFLGLAATLLCCVMIELLNGLGE